MATQVQFRRGTTAQNDAFTGAVGEVTVDTDKDTLRVHDGGTAGGFEVTRNTATQTLTNKTLTSPDINGGTIDGVTIGGSSAGAITGTTITGTSFVTSGDMTFGDNDKAIFGAGSDLEIYHDGSNSLIRDTGTGDLQLRGSHVALMDAGGNHFIYCTDTGTGGTVEIKHLGSTKLATTSTGIDVTGTVTADGSITISDGTLAQLILDDTGQTDDWYIKAQSNYIGHFYGTKLYQEFTNNGDVIFYEDTGTTAKFFWDASAERLGVGTTSPTEALHIQNGSLNLQHSSGTPTIRMNDEGIGSCYIKMPDGSNALTVETGGTERMRIDSSGNLLVGRTDANALNAGPIIKSISEFIQNGSHALIVNRNSSDGNAVLFRRQDSTVGSISVTASATAYNTSSDYRLKTDVQPMTGATERLKALKPVNFEWISSGERVDGFLAHEAAEVVPEAVTGEKDAMRTEEYEVTPAVLDDDGNVVTEAVMGTREVPDYQGIDQAKLVPLLTAALQEAVSKIEALETRIAALEA